MAAKTRARVARRWKSIGFLVLALALGGGLMSLVPGVAGADTSSGKSASFAQAHSSHAAVRGGSGHGKAIGRSRVQRTQYPPLATPEQQRNQQAAEQIEAVGPVGATRDTGGNARPTSLPMGAAAKKAAARSVTQGVRPNASTDLEFYRAHGPVPSGVTGADDTDEPSTANDGNVVLYTGNWYAAESTDSGNTFTYINPYSLGPSPTKPNGGFCCDQVVVHAPYNGVTVWGLLYCPTTCGSSPSGDNIIRLAVARNHANLESSTFDYYDFSAQDFGFPANDWLDYPHFGVNNGSLVMTLNVFNGGTFINSMVARFSLASFASGGWSANWANMSTPQDFTWTPVDGSTDTWAYWGATIYNDGTKFRVYNWPPGTDYTHVGFNDFTVSYNYEWKNGTCSAPDGLNSCAFDDSRVKTGG